MYQPTSSLVWWLQRLGSELGCVFLPSFLPSFGAMLIWNFQSILQQAHDLLSLAQALRDPAYKDSVQEAYQLLYDVLSEDGPFDGILGFSHGATLAMMFLTQHVEKNPLESPWSLVGCAVFIAGPSPLAGDGRRMTAREGEGGGKVLGIPTVHVVGREDELYEDALKMYGLCEEESKVLVEHEKGHVIPRDGETVGRMARAIRGLRRKMVNI
jgi:hypothetical protein